MGALTRGMNQGCPGGPWRNGGSGASAFTDDAFPVQGSPTHACTATVRHHLDLPVVTHCEDKSLDRRRFNARGIYLHHPWIEVIPRTAEELQVAVVHPGLAEYNRLSRLHIAHISTSAIRRDGSRHAWRLAPGHRRSSSSSLTDPRAVAGEKPGHPGRYDANTKMNF